MDCTACTGPGGTRGGSVLWCRSVCAVQSVPAASRPVRPSVGETRGRALVCRAPADREVGGLERHLEETHRVSRAGAATAGSRHRARRRLRGSRYPMAINLNGLTLHLSPHRYRQPRHLPIPIWQVARYLYLLIGQLGCSALNCPSGRPLCAQRSHYGPTLEVHNLLHCQNLLWWS